MINELNERRAELLEVAMTLLAQVDEAPELAGTTEWQECFGQLISAKEQLDALAGGAIEPPILHVTEAQAAAYIRETRAMRATE